MTSYIAELLYQKYLQTYPEKAMSRSSFYRYLNRYRLQHLPPVMRMRHKGGEKLFVDYSGDSLEYVIRETGEIISTQLFIASWGTSSYPALTEVITAAMRRQKHPEPSSSSCTTCRKQRCL